MFSYVGNPISVTAGLMSIMAVSFFFFLKSTFSHKIPLKCFKNALGINFDFDVN